MLKKDAPDAPHVSKNWALRLLRHMGMNRRALTKDTKVRHSVKEMEVGKLRLAAKVAWLMRELSIEWTHVWNIDETSIFLNPVPEKSWYWKGKAGSWKPRT